jgi:cytochrome c-type biogenesis protein CcmH
MTRIDELKARLAQLDELIRTGVLKGEAARKAREQVEAEIVAAVLQTGDAADGSAEEPAARPSWRLLGGLAGFVLAFGVAGYAWLGNPAAIGVAPGQAAPEATADAEGGTSKAQFEAMTTRLAERLKTQPEDAEGWSMLGRSYSVLERYPEAVAAYRRALALRPKEAQLYADLADAQGMVNGRKLDGEPEKLVAKALELDPDNAKALGLAGTVAFDRGDPAGAAKHWERALAKVEPGSELAGRLQAAVDEARQRAGLPPLPRATALAAAPAAPATVSPSASMPAGHPPVDKPAQAQAADGAAVQVRVSLAPALAAKASPEDTVFIFARAQQGPKAPLAIQRRQVKDLPLELTLDDSMAMNPALRLSTVPQVVVGARVSKSGNAMPQPGDLQGLSPVVAVGTRGLQLQITDVLP